MTSLTEVYDGTAGVTTLRRLYAGATLVFLGAVLSVVAVLVATTNLFAGVVGDELAAVRAAGVLAGLGVPAALVGLFVVLPASRRVRAAGAISATLCVLGVALFWHAYPTHWRGYGDDLTLEVSVVYLLGLFIAVCCLFAAVVTFKTRNDPGGMLEMNVTRQNQTVVEIDDPDPDPETGLGGVGFLGGTPDGEVETQTNSTGGTTLSFDEDQHPEATTGRRSSVTGRSPATPGGAPTSDGGSTTQDISSPLDKTDAAQTADRGEKPTDRYCGNCSEFEYVRTGSSGMVPYCARHEETMDEMDACEEWTPNR